MGTYLNGLEVAMSALVIVIVGPLKIPRHLSSSAPCGGGACQISR